MTRSRSFVVILTTLLPSTTALAQRVAPPEGAFAATATVEVNMSADAVGEPISIAPDLAYGITDVWSVAVVHSTFAMSGFRGSAGRGLCLTGDDGGCPAVYDAAGLEASANLATGTWAAAAFAGVHALSFDSDFWSARLGARVRWTQGALAVQSIPSVVIAMTGRDEPDPAPSNLDRYYLPITAAYNVIEPLAIGAGSGIKGSFQDAGDRYEISLAAFAQYAFDPRTNVGASWTFGKLLGGDAVIPADQDGVDFRAVHVWASVTR